MPATITMPDSVVAQLRPREDLTVSQFADKHRYLSKRFAFEEGYWRTAKTPYLREIMDATDDPDVQSMVFIKCARVGGTEAVNNCMLHTASELDMPIMYVQPTKEDVEDELTGRVKAMFEDCRRAAAKIVKRNWATQHHIELAGSDIYGAWPTNPQTMVRKTIGKVIFDEIDNAEAQAGYLGNSLEVLAERIVTAEERGLLFVNGTPTLATASGWRLLEASDFRRYHVPCPHCGFYQVLTLPRIEIDPKWFKLATKLAKVMGDVLSKDLSESAKPTPAQIERYQLAKYRCAGCEKLIDHGKHHRWMIDRGVWIPKGQQPEEILPLDDADIVERRSLAVQPPGETQWTPSLAGDPPLTASRGYWINVLYSPFSSRTWSHILAKFFRVKKSRDKFRVFKNSWLAEPWTEVCQQLQETEIQKKRTWSGAYKPRIMPDKAKVLFMGLDVQPDRCYFIIRAHGPGEESWGIADGQLYTTGEGENRKTDLAQAYELAFRVGFPTQRTIDYFREKYGRDIAINAAELTPEDIEHVQMVRCRAIAVDSGYAARLEEVHRFAELPGVAAVKGQSASQYGGWKRRSGDPFRRSDQQSDLHLVNVDHYRERVHRLLRLPDEQPPAFHIHMEATDDYISHLCSMHQIMETIKSGRRAGTQQIVWRLITEAARKDKLDCEIYAMFLADLFGTINLRPDQPIASQDLITLTPKATKKKRRRKGQSGGLGQGYLG